MAARVLVVDDSMVARKLLIRDLPKGWAAAIDQAKDGVEALARIGSTPYDVVFLDLNMPELDGYGVLEALANGTAPVSGARPVLFVLSGDIQPKAQERALNLGARAFLKKSTTAAELAAVLEQAGVR